MGPGGVALVVGDVFAGAADGVRVDAFGKGGGVSGFDVDVDRRGEGA